MRREYKCCLARGDSKCSCSERLESSLSHISLYESIKLSPAELQEMQKKNQLEKLHIKLLIYKSQVEARILSLDTIKQELFKYLELSIQSEIDKCTSIISEIEHKTHLLKETSAEALDLLNTYHTSKLPGLIRSYIEIKPVTAEEAKIYLDRLLECEDFDHPQDLQAKKIEELNQMMMLKDIEIKKLRKEVLKYETFIEKFYLYNASRNYDQINQDSYPVFQGHNQEIPTSEGIKFLPIKDVDYGVSYLINHIMATGNMNGYSVEECRLADYRVYNLARKKP
jgi:hypothetical protein